MRPTRIREKSMKTVTELCKAEAQFIAKVQSSKGEWGILVKHTSQHPLNGQTEFYHIERVKFPIAVTKIGEKEYAYNSEIWSVKEKIESAPISYEVPLFQEKKQ